MSRWNPRRSALLLALVCSVGVGCEDAEEATGTASGPVYPTPPGTSTALGTLAPRPALLVRSITVAGSQNSSTAPGFDLDGRVSTATDREACGKRDFTSPDGVPGIDNQIGAVWSSVYSIVGQPVNGLIGDAVNEGRLSLILELDDLDDFTHDDSVGVTLYRATNPNPILGTKGLIQAGQTFEVQPEKPVVGFEPTAIVDGVLRLGPFDYPLDVDLFQANFRLNLIGVIVELREQPDGSWHGYMGAGVSVEEISAVATEYAPNESRAIVPLLPNLADLEPGANGKCTYVSAVLEVDAVPSFLAR
jgi:hypothetical protein